MDTKSQLQLLRLTEVSKLTSIGKSTINLWVAQGKFPRPLHLSPTIKVWRQQDIVDWIDSIATNKEFTLDIIENNLASSSLRVVHG
jgi:predicted DNA-binding transcriptional regulator AlpA